jgi:hypothetical protein
LYFHVKTELVGEGRPNTISKSRISLQEARENFDSTVGNEIVLKV